MYQDEVWRPALKAVMDAEGDVDSAKRALKESRARQSQPKLTIKLLARPSQTILLEDELMNAISSLKDRNRVFGTLPTVDDLVNPSDEKVDVDADKSANEFPGGLPKIIAHVQQEFRVQRGEVIEVDDEVLAARWTRNRYVRGNTF